MNLIRMHLKHISSVALVAAFTLALFLVAAYPAHAQSTHEEFFGPFASWRQVQCTGQDDTRLLQDELSSLGRSGSPVLYIRPGTCRITATLHLGQGAGGADGVHDVTILGHDPADTR